MFPESIFDVRFIYEDSLIFMNPFFHICADSQFKKPRHG
jgi:hypothetical protein